MTTRLHNLTPHPIVIQTADRTVTLLPAATPPRITEHRTPAQPVSHDGNNIPLWHVTTGTVTGLPEPEPRTWYIVFRPVALAAPDRTDLLVPYDVHRNPQGQVTACTSLARLTPPPPS